MTFAEKGTIDSEIDRIACYSRIRKVNEAVQVGKGGGNPRGTYLSLLLCLWIEYDMAPVTCSFLLCFFFHSSFLVVCACTVRHT